MRLVCRKLAGAPRFYGSRLVDKVRHEMYATPVRRIDISEAFSRSLLASLDPPLSFLPKSRSGRRHLGSLVRTSSGFRRSVERL